MNASKLFCEWEGKIGLFVIFMLPNDFVSVLSLLTGYFKSLEAEKELS